LLDDIQITRLGVRQRFASGNIVQVKLAHGHFDAAFDYLLHHDDPAFHFSGSEVSFTN